MERALATIQTISALDPIPGADAIEAASVLGWKVVVRKGEFKVGGRAVYCELDSVLPEKPEFEFLRKCRFRIKTVKLRGQISQGILFPLSGFPGDSSKLRDGQDVTKELGVIKYEPVLPVNLRGKAASFPAFIPKTDEIRLQSVLGVLDELRGIPCYVTQKLDGSSMTAFVRDGEFGLCTRNLQLLETEEAAFRSTPWDYAKSIGLAEKLRALGQDLAFQGEICGPGIQSNRMGYKEICWRIFDVWNIETWTYLGLDGLLEWTMKAGLETVPLIERGRVFVTEGLNEFLAMADAGVYSNGSVQEGIVVRPERTMHSEQLKGRLSFKMISNKFLLKYGE